MSSFHASAKILNFIDTRPKDNEVKGAVQLKLNIQQFLNGDKTRKSVLPMQLNDKTVPCSTFAIFDKQEDNLTDFINRLGNQLGQTLSSNDSDECAYGLMFEDGRRFVTEHNKHMIQQGFLLIFTASPLTRLDLRCDASAALADLALFSSLSTDVAFADALKTVGGVKQLITLIENGTFETNVMILCQLLQILLVLMGHPGVANSDDFTRKFIEKMAIYVNGSSKIENNDSLHLSLNIILNVMNQYSQHTESLRQEVKFETLIRHLENSDERILLSALMLMTSIYTISDSEEKQAIVKILHSKPFVAAIETGITRESRSPDQRIRRQLVQIQEILMEELRNLALRSPTEQEIDYIMAMEEWDPKMSLLKFGGTLLHRESTSILGGTNVEMDNEPVHIDETQLEAQRAVDAATFRQIVQNTPPGLLAIDAILDFSRPKGFTSSTRLKEIQAESLLRVSVWPMVMANLTKSLISALGICADEDDVKRSGGNDFSQIILKSERPFYDVFAISVELFHRTWREMHANACDLDKVIFVVDDQIKRVFAINPASKKLLNELLEKKFSYYNMQKIWERERIEQEELELNSAEIKWAFFVRAEVNLFTYPFRALREHLRPQIEELVLERKKSFLKRGLLFTKFSFGKTQGKEIQQQQQQYWHWKLDEKERFFCYADCKIVAGTNQMELDLTTSKKSDDGQGGFGSSSTNVDSSSTMVNDQIHLTTNNEADLNAWINGINCLITPQLATQAPTISSEVQRMLNMEVRVRLLDVRNTLSEKAPPVPPLPQTFSWIPGIIAN